MYELRVISEKMHVKETVLLMAMSLGSECVTQTVNRESREDELRHKGTFAPDASMIKSAKERFLLSQINQKVFPLISSFIGKQRTQKESFFCCYRIMFIYRVINILFRTTQFNILVVPTLFITRY